MTITLIIGVSKGIGYAAAHRLIELFGVPVTETVRGIYERRLKEWAAWKDLAIRAYGR